MLLLHPRKRQAVQQAPPPKTHIQAPALAITARAKSVTVSSQPASQVLLAQQTPVVDVLEYTGTDVSKRSAYLTRVVRSQSRSCTNRKAPALAGAGVGAFFGCVIGAAATGPFFPIWGVSGALIGAAMGGSAAPPVPQSFRQVRKYMFFRAGIVDSRWKSARLVKALKRHEVLNRGRARDILSLQNLDAALSKQPLNAKQRKQVRQSLELIAKEGSSFDALARERDRLLHQISASRSLHRGEGTAAPELAALYTRHARIESRLRPVLVQTPGPMPLAIEEPRRGSPAMAPPRTAAAAGLLPPPAQIGMG